MSQQSLKDLKPILQKDDTLQGFNQFRDLLTRDKKPCAEDINILLRWCIQNQKQEFKHYYTLLMGMGANVNFADTRQGKTNLMLACQQKRQDIVQLLADDKDINFLLEDSRHKTALSYAILNKNRASGEKYARILLKRCPQLVIAIKRGAKKNNPLAQAIRQVRLEIIKALFEAGMNPNDPIDQNGNTVLHETFRALKSKKNQLQILEVLIENGADPYIKNTQGKDCFQIMDKRADEFKKIYNDIKNKEKEKEKEKQKQSVSDARVLLVINNAEQRQSIYKEAEQIYEKYKGLIEEKEKKKEVLAAFDKDEKGFDEDPFEPHYVFVDQLTHDIEVFSNQCLLDHSNAQKQLQQFLTHLAPITSQLGFSIEIYGSYATGLWINHCDIDILLIPQHEQAIKSTVEQHLEHIAQRLKNTVYEKLAILRNLKIPLMRIQVGQDNYYRKSRKLDISILTPNNNGLQHVRYVKQFIDMFPEIKPLFFVIKKLTHCYRLYDPLKYGIRSLAIFLMLVIFMQQPHSQNLGGLLLKFFHKYGYKFDYEYEDNGHKMILNLPDPFNTKNNIGNNTDAFCLQRMFKTAYLILHTRDADGRLEFLFDSREMFALY